MKKMEENSRSKMRDSTTIHENSSSILPESTPSRSPRSTEMTASISLGNLSGKTSKASSSLISPQNGDSQWHKNSPSKIVSIKNWSISTYKCTKQLMYEKFGKSSRTMDTELENQIEGLRDTQKKYANILRLVRTMTSHFYHVVQTQHLMGEAFSDLAQKSPELQEEFLYNSETQRNLMKNGEVLLSALHFFISSVNTLCNKTIEDTLLTVRQYETASCVAYYLKRKPAYEPGQHGLRIEYDAYRTDLELLVQASSSETNSERLEKAQTNFERHKMDFEKLRADVVVKLKFLDENRVKVMHKQLLLFHNAISAYFSGNQQALEATLKQFNVKVRPPNSALPSWLEQ